MILIFLPMQLQQYSDTATLKFGAGILEKQRHLGKGAGEICENRAQP
jgi:hypothetical protein